MAFSFKNNEMNEASFKAVKAEEVAIAYRQLRLSALAVIINSMTLLWILWSVVDHNIATAWLMCQLLIIAYRWHNFRSYRFERGSYTDDEWKKSFLFGMVLSAVVWGMAPVIMFPAEAPLHLSALVIIIAGMSAGAVSSLASIRYAAQIYLSILLLPTSAILLVQPDPLYGKLAFLIVLYWLLLMVVARRIYDNIATALRSRIMYEKASSELELSEERFETIFKEAPAGIFYYDNDLIVIDTNSEMLHILGIDRNEMVGLDMKKLPDKSLHNALTAPMAGEKGHFEGPYTTMINKLNLWITLQTSPIYDAERSVIGGVGIVTDITDRISAQEQMKYQAYYDALTNIPNRTLLKDRIDQSLAHYRRHHSLFAVMFLDLDNFKTINDSLGHHIGDALLVEIARRLSAICREEDTVARLGGDEFVILLNELGNEPHGAAERAETVAEKIHEALAAPFEIGQNEPIMSSTSIGIAVVADQNQNGDDLLKFADTAMYQAKKEGRNTTRFYLEEMDQWIKKRLFMENALRNAIKNGELELYYQPLIEIETKKIVGAEALLRWNHPDMGLVMPDEMIYIAEESGLIVPIGDWALKEACTQFSAWKNECARGSDINRIAVNVSAVQFRQNDFVDKVIQIITETGISPSMVEIELTESIIIDNIDPVIEKMNRLRVFGVGISMDDFGTGYSSLAYLKRLPFSTLKIDRSFIRDIMIDKDDAALVETMLSMASIFNLDVIAEGVETIEQFQFLEEHGCRYFQGYLCSRPVKVEMFEELLNYDIHSCQSH